MPAAFEMQDVGLAKPQSTVAVQADPADPTAFEDFEENAKSQEDQRDTFLLARLGKKQATKRNFGFMSMVAFSCTVLVTWEGVYTSVPDYVNGGSAGLIYGYIVIWAGTLSTFVSISELASIAPTAGGQYHWVSMLAPKYCRKFLSYLTGKFISKSQE